MRQTTAGRECWRIRCHPFGSDGGLPRVGDLRIQGVTAEGVTIVAPGGGFRLSPEELRQLAESSWAAVRAQQRCADGLR